MSPTTKRFRSRASIATAVSRSAKRFDEREKFRFPPPIGEVPVYLAAQDEVCMLPYVIKVRDVDAKIGGNDFDRLRRWYRQGRLNRSAGIIRKRFPQTLTPRSVAKLIRTGVLENARFAAAVVVRGKKGDDPLLIRWDASFPTLYTIRQRGLVSTPIAYATAHLAAIFVKHFPRDRRGRHRPRWPRARNAPRHPRRRPLPRFPPRHENHPPQEARRRRRILTVTRTDGV